MSPALDEPPRVELTPRHRPRHAQVSWDGESHVLSISVGDDEPSGQPRTLSQYIDHQLGISPHEYRVVLGGLDILLDSGKQLRSMAVRTNPADWQRSPLAPLPGALEQVSLLFPVVYDINHIASIEVPIRITVDESRSQLRFALGYHLTSRWASIADRVAVGVTADGCLSEFRISDADAVRGALSDR